MNITWWTAQTDEELIDCVERYYRYDQQAKLDLAKSWEENIRFVDGDQYIRYDASTRSYAPIPNYTDTEYLPRPKTNHLWSRAELLRSNLTRQPPIFRVKPNTTDPIDEQRAKVAEAVHEARWALDGERQLAGEAAEWGLMTGNAFKKTAWMPNETISIVIPQPDGSETEQLLPLGDVASSVVSPFRMAPDPVATSLKACRWIMEYAWHPVALINEWFDKTGDGYTGAHVTAEESDARILKMDANLQQRMWQRGLEAPSEDRAILKEVYIEPDREHPEGRLIVVANNKLLYKGPSPYGRMTRKIWHPYTHFRYNELPGTFWGRTPLTEAVPLQRRLNALDSMVLLHLQTMGFGQWLIPDGTLKNSGLTGRIGLKITYRSNAKGEKPEKTNGTPLGPEIFEKRSLLISELDEILGTKDILRGQMPDSAASGISLEILRENVFARSNPMFERWEDFQESAAQLKLQLIAKYYLENRPLFTQQLQQSLRQLHGMDIRNFIGTYLRDNSNIRVESGSSFPQSKAAQLDFLQRFGEAGLLGDLVNDPYRNQLFLQQFGITQFKTATNADYEKAQWELSMIEAGQIHLLKIDENDNNQLHMEVFEAKLKNPSYFTSRSPQMIQQAWSFYNAQKAAGQQKQQAAEQAQRQQRDEQVYVKALEKHGGPGRSPPTLNLFPSALMNEAPHGQTLAGQGQPSTNHPGSGSALG